MNKIKVVLADDHSIFRNGVKSLLENEKDIEIIGEAANGEETLEKVRALSPDILLVDISMPKMSGIEVAEIVNKQYKHTKALILSMHNNDDYILKSVECGAYGYLLKDTSKEEMLKALHAVASGEKYFAGTVSSTIVNGYLDKFNARGADDKSDKPKLSRQEKAILQFIIQGLSSREIAEKLDLSDRTVNNHRANMMKKLDVRNAAELVRLSIKLNLI